MAEVTRLGAGLTGSAKVTFAGGADCGRFEETVEFALCPLDVRAGGESKDASKVRSSTGGEGSAEESVASRVTMTGDMRSG